MGDADSRGPQVPPEETLHQFVTVPSFWVAKENRPSSSLFDNPPRVSVNVASLTTIDECKQQLRKGLGKPNGGMVSYNCGQARELGFDARHEPEHGNQAHAHLYSDLGVSNKRRKKNAVRLARLCSIVIQPQF
jgi:hypothetical protein